MVYSHPSQFQDCRGHYQAHPQSIRLHFLRVGRLLEFGILPVRLSVPELHTLSVVYQF